MKDSDKDGADEYQVVLPEWIDHNGHMNMGFYGVLFDRGSSRFWRRIGFGQGYRDRTNFTTFAGEFRVRYLRELKEGDRVRTTFRIVDVGPKSFHYFQELVHEDGWIAAISEHLSLHIDRSGPKVCPYPDEVRAKLEAMRDEQAGEPLPDWVGTAMRVRK